MRLNRACVIPGRGCVCGVVGFGRMCSAGHVPLNMLVSGSGVETPAVEGDSPVRESLCVVVVLVPE